MSFTLRITDLYKQISGQEKKNSSDCSGQVNFALGKLKMEVWGSSGQVVVLLHTYWASNILVGTTENWNVLAHW